MKIERTRNAGRNIVFGIIQKVYTIIVPFIMRTAMIYLMGAQYLGLNSLFSSILQVLNLAELGVGGAIFYSMYKPIAEDDTERICALMALYKKYYRIIGLVILIVGLAISPFLPQLIKMDTVPSDVNVFVLYYLNLGATVLSYWLFAYKNCLIGAHQRNDISSKISMVSSTVTYVLQFAIIYFWRNLYAYTVIVLAVGIINNIITAAIVDQMYPQYKPAGKLTKSEVTEINHRVRDLFTSKIGGVVYNSSDTIVISAFLGMKVLAVFQNYFFIQTSIKGMIDIVFGSCTAGIGNSLVVESKEKNFNDLNKFTFIICWVGGFCVICLLCLYQPFMELWVGEDLMLDFTAVTCIAIYFYISQINMLLNLYKDAGGIWHEDRFRPLITSFVNLGLNLIFVGYIGIYGILLSTVLASTVIGMPWLLHNLFTVMFEKKYLKIYLKKVFLYTTVVAIVGMIVCFLCSFFSEGNLIICLCIRGLICLILPNVLFYVIYRKVSEFRQSLTLLDKMTKGKLNKVIRYL